MSGRIDPEPNAVRVETRPDLLLAAMEPVLETGWERKLAALFGDHATHLESETAAQPASPEREPREEGL